MAPDEPPKVDLVTSCTFAAVIMKYMASPKFTNLASGTQDGWGRQLRLAAHPDCLGLVSIAEIRPALVQAFMDGLADRPSKQETALSALRAVEKYAIVRDYLPRQITLGVEIGESDGGHIPWTDEHVACAEKHARADIAQAICLGANTGQRGSDLIRLGWTDIEKFEGIEGFRLVQKKTGREVWVPIISNLATAMKAWPRVPGPFLRRQDGNPWTRKDLTMAWSNHRDGNRAFDHFRNLGPDKDRPLVLHGLRGHACVRLKRSGANTNQIADMVGMSEAMVKNYTRFSSQQANAAAAVINLEKTIRERENRLSIAVSR